MSLNDPETDVAPGETRGGNVRSRGRRSMCPAIHIYFRSWLRSSSTREPSDPPSRVVFLLSLHNKKTEIAETNGDDGQGRAAAERAASPLFKTHDRQGYPPPTGGQVAAERGETTPSPTIPLKPLYPHQPCTKCARCSVMILPQVHLRKPCYDFYFL